MAARRCSGSMLVPCSLFSLASFSSLLDHTPFCYLSLDRQGGFLPDTLRGFLIGTDLEPFVTSYNLVRFTLMGK